MGESALSLLRGFSIPFERQGRDRVQPASSTQVWTVRASVPVQGGGLSGWGTDSVIGMHTAPCQMMPLIVLRWEKNSPFHLKSGDGLLTVLSYHTAHYSIVKGNVSEGTEGWKNMKSNFSHDNGSKFCWAFASHKWELRSFPGWFDQPVYLQWVSSQPTRQLTYFNKSSALPPPRQRSGRGRRSSPRFTSLREIIFITSPAS